MPSAKQLYLPAPRDSVSEESGSDVDGTEGGQLASCSDSRCKPTRLGRGIVISLILLSSLLLASNLIWVLRFSRYRKEQVSSRYTGLDRTPHTLRGGYERAEYASDNQSVAQAAWAAIRPGHGVVALDYSQAAALRLPYSMPMPNDSRKGVYTLSAYHSIHCLVAIRRTWTSLRAGTIPERSVEHTAHCFDTLRQHIMCTADDTLLYTLGHGGIGRGQSRECRDWGALRDWASERTACYAEHQTSGGSYFGQCDGGTDGLLIN